MCGGCTVMTDCLPSTWRDRRSNHISQAPACCRSKSTGAQKGYPPFRRRWNLVSPCGRNTASDLASSFHGLYRRTGTAQGIQATCAHFRSGRTRWTAATPELRWRRALFEDDSNYSTESERPVLSSLYRTLPVCF